MRSGASELRLGRRRFVALALLATTAPAWATLAPTELARLTALARTLFPHPFLADAHYAGIVAGIAAQAPAADIRAALAQPTTAGFVATPFGETLRAGVMIGLYHDLNVTRRFGYQGPSLEEGGYLHRGFDDLDWLPTP